MMWQEEGCIMYEVFFVNFWVIFLCSSLRTLKPLKNLKNPKKLKNLKAFPPKLWFFQPWLLRHAVTSHINMSRNATSKNLRNNILPLHVSGMLTGWIYQKSISQCWVLAAIGTKLNQIPKCPKSWFEVRPRTHALMCFWRGAAACAGILNTIYRQWVQFCITL